MVNSLILQTSVGPIVLVFSKKSNFILIKILAPDTGLEYSMLEKNH